MSARQQTLRRLALVFGIFALPAALVVQVSGAAYEALPIAYFLVCVSITALARSLIPATARYTS